MAVSHEWRLLKAWLILMSLTAISVLAAWSGQAIEGQGGVAILVLMGSAFVKTRQVLDHFLELRAAKEGWRSFFTMLMAGLLLLLLAAGLVFVFFQKPL
jgi:heme/copper-type cytochrome/quinol oxidase subunit 4